MTLFTTADILRYKSCIVCL